MAEPPAPPAPTDPPSPDPVAPPDAPAPPRPRRLGLDAPRRWLDALLGAGQVAVVLLVVALLALLVLAWRALDPTPERRVVLATGADQGAYHEFGRRYGPLLREHGVELVLRPTQGSAENLALLRDPRSDVQVAFVQGGVAGPAPAGAPELVSLGSVAWEPLWIFLREASVQGRPGGEPPRRLSQLAGWRVHVGPEGGGTGALLRRLAADSGLDAAQLVAGRQALVHAVVELVEGRVDALAVVSAADAPLVQYLLRTPGVRLMDLAQAEAYGRRFPFLRPLVLPRGVVDLAADLPPTDLQLVATSASLVARERLHPALQQLLLQAARRVHGEPGWFATAGEFPNPTAAEFALSDEAERFHRGGTPWLQRTLPFWVANFIERMWFVVLPLLAALVPLSRVLPPLVELRVRSRVFRWYANLRDIERALDQPGADVAALAQELEGVESRVDRVGVPLAYAHELYALRSHIQLVRRRLQARGAATPAAPRR